MSIEDLTQMKEKAIEMSKYYYKGFGATIDGILNNAQLYLRHPEREILIDNSYKWLQELENVYAKISFDNLHGKEEFYPLFIIKRLLPQFRESMDEIFKFSNNGWFRNFGTDGKTIVNVGRLYEDSFLKLLEEIRTHPEAHNFRIKIIDHKCEAWYF